MNKLIESNDLYRTIESLEIKQPPWNTMKQSSLGSLNMSILRFWAPQTEGDDVDFGDRPSQSH